MSNGNMTEEKYKELYEAIVKILSDMGLGKFIYPFSEHSSYESNLKYLTQDIIAKLEPLVSQLGTAQFNRNVPGYEWVIEKEVAISRIEKLYSIFKEIDCKCGFGYEYSLSYDPTVDVKSLFFGELLNDLS